MKLYSEEVRFRILRRKRYIKKLMIARMNKSLLLLKPLNMVLKTASAAMKQPNTSQVISIIRDALIGFILKI